MTVAAHDHLDRITRLIPGYDAWATAGDCHFDHEEAQRAIDFIQTYLRHVKGKLAGKLVKLEDWQQAIIANLFGWKRPDGTRRYREALIYVARKNGKTVLGAAIALYMLFCDGEPGAELYSAGGNEEQATLCFWMAAQMILQDADLSRRSKVLGNAITYGTSTFQPVTAKAETKHGYSPHFALVDELHVHKNRDLLDVLITGMGAREQPLCVEITTADYDRPESICNERHDYASKVRDGIIEDPYFLPVIYEASKDDDWKDPATWAKANPNLGISVKLEYMTAQCKRAQEIPGYENTFKRLHLNIITEQATRWLPMDAWDACGVEPLPELTGRDCFGGLDLASTSDVAALVLDFPIDKLHCLLPIFWIPEDNAVQREKKNRIPYTVWARQGLIRTTPGNVIDYDIIRRDINELKKIYNIREIAIDRWAATQITTQLQGDGHEMVPFGQGYGSMSAPAKELEKLVIGKQLRHGAHPVLRWMASNVAIVTDDTENIKPTKKRSSGKVDGIVAAVMAIGRAIAQDPNDGKSVYGDRGIDFI